MARRGSEPAARALLFERLIDREPARSLEPVPFRTVDRRGLMESVRREVDSLLNTHCRFTEAFISGRERTAYDYGVPDYQNFSPRSAADRGRLERLLSATIEAYEPRLQRPQVTVVELGHQEWQLVVRIEGRLVSEEIDEPVSFPARIYRGGRREGS